jgi:hypothetical protein
MKATILHHAVMGYFYGAAGGSLCPTPGLWPGLVGRNASPSSILWRFTVNQIVEGGFGLTGLAAATEPKFC